MTHKRNLEGLRRSACLKHRDSLLRADQAIHLLVREGRAVNFRTVSMTAGVSTAWLYQQADLKQRIQQLREKNAHRVAVAVPQRERASDASKEAMITTLRERLKHLEEENKELKRKVEVAYGQLYHQSS